MEVKIVLQNWEVTKQSKTNLPTVAGRYAIMVGNKEIASQKFNEGYDSKEISFSGELISALKGLEDLVVAELTKMLQ